MFYTNMIILYYNQWYTKSRVWFILLQFKINCPFLLYDLVYSNHIFNLQSMIKCNVASNGGYIFAYLVNYKVVSFTFLAVVKLWKPIQSSCPYSYDKVVLLVGNICTGNHKQKLNLCYTTLSRNFTIICIRIGLPFPEIFDTRQENLYNNSKYFKNFSRSTTLTRKIHWFNFWRN